MSHDETFWNTIGSLLLTLLTPLSAVKMLYNFHLISLYNKFSVFQYKPSSLPCLIYLFLFLVLLFFGLEYPLLFPLFIQSQFVGLKFLSLPYSLPRFFKIFLISFLPGLKVPDNLTFNCAGIDSTLLMSCLQLRIHSKSNFYSLSPIHLLH